MSHLTPRGLRADKKRDHMAVISAFSFVRTFMKPEKLSPGTRSARIELDHQISAPSAQRRGTSFGSGMRVSLRTPLGMVDLM